MLSSRVSQRGLHGVKCFGTRKFSTTQRALLEEVYIVGAARTATGKFMGSFKDTPAPVLASHTIRAALSRSTLPTEAPTHVYLGNVLSAGLGQSPARQATIFSGLPSTCESTTINKVCASGLKSVSLAAQDIQLGLTNCAVAGGMENMSLVPRYIPRTPPSYGHVQAEDGVIQDGLWDVYNKFAMGNCAENTAKKLNITRQDQDEYAIESYRRAKAAWEKGLFNEEVVPVEIPQKKGPALVVKEDEEYNAIKLDKIPTLKPAFIKDPSVGTITAANSSTLSDGASALVLVSKSLVDSHSLQNTRVFARILASADAATHPIDFPLAPTFAIPLALKRAGLEIKDIHRFEINEAFAAVSVANERVLGLDRAKVNVNGGAVALGHALGSSGSRILVSLLYGLKAGEIGVAGICNGGGGATAMVVQKL